MNLIAKDLTVHLGNKIHVPEKEILNVAVCHYMSEFLI